MPIKAHLLRCPPRLSLRRTSKYASLGLVRRLASGPFSTSLLIASVLLLASNLVGAVEKGAEEKASACVSCHRDLGGKMAEPVALWEKSYHRQMGNNCEGCHGGDPNDAASAMSPEKGFVGAPKPDEIPAFCGKCHVGVMENYQQSFHAGAALAGTGPNCVTCHESHNVQRASFELISEELCARCHPYENAQRIKRAFISAEVGLNEQKEALRTLGRRGMPTRRAEEKLFALRNSLHQMTHTLDIDEISRKTDSVLKDLKAMGAEMEEFRSRIQRRWKTGAIVAFFLAVLIIVLIRLLKTYEEG